MDIPLKKREGMVNIRRLNSRKSQIWISAVLYVLIISVIMVIVLEAGVPIMNNLRDKSVFVQTRDNFINLDMHIKEIGSAGPGSQRVVPIEIKKGELALANSQLEWTMDTKASIIQPRTSLSLGNVRIGSDSDVNAYSNSTDLVLENYYLKAVFNRVGNESNFGTINSTSLLKSIENVKTGTATSGEFSFLIDDISVESDGYSKISQQGYNLGSATVIFHINMSGGAVHDLSFTLDSRSDYLKVSMT
jgi:hypothetical protein